MAFFFLSSTISNEKDFRFLRRYRLLKMMSLCFTKKTVEVGKLIHRLKSLLTDFLRTNIFSSLKATFLDTPITCKGSKRVNDFLTRHSYTHKNISKSFYSLNLQSISLSQILLAINYFILFLKVFFILS